MAGRTSRIVIGTGIANVYLRHPVMLAIAAATIADLSGGRLVLGLGPNNAQMIARAGLAWRDPREVLRETTATLGAVFAGEAQPGLRPPPPSPTRSPCTGRPWRSRPVRPPACMPTGSCCTCAAWTATGVPLRACSGAEGAGRNPADVSVILLVPTFVHDDLPIAPQAARRFLVHSGMPQYAKAFEATASRAVHGVRKGLAAAMQRPRCPALRSAAGQGLPHPTTRALPRAARRLPGGRIDGRRSAPSVSGSRPPPPSPARREQLAPR